MSLKGGRVPRRYYGSNFYFDKLVKAYTAQLQGEIAPKVKLKHPDPRTLDYWFEQTEAAHGFIAVRPYVWLCHPIILNTYFAEESTTYKEYQGYLFWISCHENAKGKKHGKITTIDDIKYLLRDVFYDHRHLTE